LLEEEDITDEEMEMLVNMEDYDDFTNDDISSNNVKGKDTKL